MHLRYVAPFHEVTIGSAKRCGENRKVAQYSWWAPMLGASPWRSPLGPGRSSLVSGNEIVLFVSG